MRSWTVAAALLVAAAGCATPAEPAVETNVSLPAPAPGAAASPPGMEPARFGEGDPVDLTLWFNGTFKLQDANRPPQAPGIAPAPAAAWVPFDLTSSIPVGIPAALQARVDVPLQHGDVDLWFDASDEEWRTGGGCQPRGGFSEVALGIVHANDPVTLNLFYDEAEPAPEFAYAVHVRVAADPTVVPGGMSAALAVPPGTSSLAVEAVGAPRDGCMFDLETPNLMLWAPDDAFLGHTPLEEGMTTIPLPDEEGGEYVVLLSQGGRGLRVHAPPGATLRALAQEFVVSDPHRGVDATTVEWTTEVRRVPTLAGMVFSSPVVAKDVAFRYASPTTTFFEGTFEGGPWLSANVPGGPPSGFWLDSAFGVPGLESGTYTGRVKFGHGAGAEPLSVSDLAAYWIR